MLSNEICEIFKNTYFEEHVRKTASICSPQNTITISGGEFGLDETSTECISVNQMKLYNLYVIVS